MIFIKQTGDSFNRKTLIKLFITEKPATYSNQECTIEQCKKGAFRSVTELLEIVQTYFPKTTLEDILRIINSLISENNQIALIWCTQVKKVVLKYTTNQEKEFVTTYSINKFKDAKGVDGYSISDYLKIINNL